MIKFLRGIVREVRRLLRDLVFVGPAVASTMRVLNCPIATALRVEKKICNLLIIDC